MVLNNLVRGIIPPHFKKKAASSLTAAFLSVGSDADIASDWAYWVSVKDNPNIPIFLKQATQFFVFVSTMLYLMQITDGRGFKRVFKNCFGVQVTKRKIVQWSVWYEDIPQVILTLLITITESMSTMGAVNIVASVVDAVQKTKALLEDAVEEEEDDEVVEEQAAALNT